MTKEFKVQFIYEDKKAKKRKRIDFSFADIQALLFLNEQHFLTLPQLIDFSSLIQYMNPKAFRNKVARWENAKIVKKKPIRLQNGHTMMIVGLTNTGVSLLKKLGYLDENARAKDLPNTNNNNIDHAIAIRQNVIDVISLYTDYTGMAYYLAKDLYYIGIKDNEHFNQNAEPVIIYQNKLFGEDRIHHFKKYDFDFDNTDNLLTSINPYRAKESYTKVVADWLFELKGQYIHLEIDCGNETLKQSNVANDTSFEGKISRLQEQLEIQHIKPENYHMLFVMVDNREDTVLKLIHPPRIKRVENTKQEMARFKSFYDTNFNVYVLRFSRSYMFLANLINEIIEKKNLELPLLEIIKTAFSEKGDLQFKGWNFLTFTNHEKYESIATLEKEFLKKFSFAPSGTYQANLFMGYFNPTTKSVQFLLPFYANEGDVRNAEQLAILAEDVNKNRYGNGTKILVFYRNEDTLLHDVIRKNKVTAPKDDFAMDTSRMLFVSAVDMATEDEPTIFYDESKKRKAPNVIFNL